MFSWYPPYIQLLLTCVVFSNQKMCWKWLITFSIPSSLAFSRLICERFWVGLPARASMQHQSDSVWSKFCKNHENWNGVKSQRNGVKSQRNGVFFLDVFSKRWVQLELDDWSLNWLCSQFMRPKHGCELQAWKVCSSHHAFSFPISYLQATLLGVVITSTVFLSMIHPKNALMKSKQLRAHGALVASPNGENVRKRR